MVIALHYSATLDKDADREMLLQDVLKPAARFYASDKKEVFSENKEAIDFIYIRYDI